LFRHFMGVSWAQHDGRLQHPELIAVGMFKLGLAIEPDTWYWVGEIHQIVAGAEAAELKNAFTGKAYKYGFQGVKSLVQVREVTKLGPTVDNIFKRELRVWRKIGSEDWKPGDKWPPTVQSWQMWESELSGCPPDQTCWTEYCRWLLHLQVGVRLIRYGCDKYFDRVEKIQAAKD
jgi:hypothetical protein